MSSNEKVSLCSTDDIHDPGSMGFEVERDGNNIDVFVVHKDGEFYAYINSCPHTGASLEWQQHRFLDMGNDFIQCSTHDALFEIPTGVCVKGPCSGDHLKALRIEQHAGQLVVELS